MIYLKKKANVSVRRKENEDFESLNERFKREVNQSGILKEVVARRHHMSKGEKRKYKSEQNNKRK